MKTKIIGMRKRILIPSIISALLLIIAAFPISEYGFYVFLRWAICGLAAYVGYRFYKSTRPGWSWIIWLVAIAFNPFIPVYFSMLDVSEIWTGIDFS